MIRYLFSRQFLVSWLIGGAAVAVNFGSRIAYSQHFVFSIAIILACLTGAVAHLLLVKVLGVKRRQCSKLNAVLHFILITLFVALQVWAISMVMAYYLLPMLGVSEYLFEIANIIGIFTPILIGMVFSKLSKQFMFFLLTGGTAAAINFGSRIVYNQYVDFSAAVIFAYITGMITAFVLAKLFVFKESQQSLHKSALFFILVNLVAIVQTWGISMGLAHYLLPFLGVTRYVPEIAHATGVAVPVFTSYIGHKHWSFR